MEEGRLAQNKESVGLPGKVRKCLTEQAALRCSAEAPVKIANAGGGEAFPGRGQNARKGTMQRYQGGVPVEWWAHGSTRYECLIERHLLVTLNFVKM